MKDSQNVAIFSLRVFFFLGILFNNKEFVTEYPFWGVAKCWKFAQKKTLVQTELWRNHNGVTKDHPCIIHWKPDFTQGGISCIPSYFPLTIPR